MFKPSWILVATLILILTACGSAATPTAIPTIVLPSNGAQNPSASAASVSATGQVIPVEHVELSFPLTGVVKIAEVRAGDSVSAGETLVTLDSTLLQAKVEEAQANVEAAQAHAHYLARTGASQEDLDSAQADVDHAQALLDSAKAIVAQATLVAPFAGTIAEVDIFPAETVVSGQI